MTIEATLKVNFDVMSLKVERFPVPGDFSFAIRPPFDWIFDLRAEKGTLSRYYHYIIAQKSKMWQSFSDCPVTITSSDGFSPCALKNSQSLSTSSTREESAQHPSVQKYCTTFSAISTKSRFYIYSNHKYAEIMPFNGSSLLIIAHMHNTSKLVHCAVSIAILLFSLCLFDKSSRRRMSKLISSK